jgi:hypothetical protein
LITIGSPSLIEDLLELIWTLTELGSAAQRQTPPKTHNIAIAWLIPDECSLALLYPFYSTGLAFSVVMPYFPLVFALWPGASSTLHRNFITVNQRNQCGN